MPVKSTKRTEKQIWYDKERVTNTERINSNIAKDYIRLLKQNKAKGFIINYLRNKYRNKDGSPFSHQRIYNALDLKKIHNEIRAMQECNPSIGA